MSDIIPIKKEEVTPPEASNLSTDQNPGTDFNRSLIPVTTATVGRSLKLRDLFSVSGAVVCNADVVTVTANGSSGNETDMKSFVLFPNEWHVGMCLRITANGVITQDGTRSVNIRIGSGLAPTTTWNAMTSTPPTAASDAPWNLVWYGILKSIGSSGTIEVQMTGNIDRVNHDYPRATTFAIDTTSKVTIAMTADWTASNAGNSLSVRQWIVEVLY